jgi:molybdopterin biosynthesis enzyme
MAVNPKPSERSSAILDAVRRAARQEQFLEVVSAEEARRRFAACIDLSPLGGETVLLANALSRALAADVVAPVDAPRSIAPTSMVSRCAPRTQPAPATARRDGSPSTPRWLPAE